MRDEVDVVVCKTPWFSRKARRTGLADGVLLRAARDALAGYAEDLGGGVLKKRLRNNEYRSILLQCGRVCVFAYLYAKQDRDDIDRDELIVFRRLAQQYARMTPAEIERALDQGVLLELIHDHSPSLPH